MTLFKSRERLLLVLAVSFCITPDALSIILVFGGEKSSFTGLSPELMLYCFGEIGVFTFMLF